MTAPQRLRERKVRWRRFCCSRCRTWILPGQKQYSDDGGTWWTCQDCATARWQTTTREDMTMSNTRKLRTREFIRPVSISELDHADDTAYTGETCAFHPDCCDPEDFTCQGCGEPAVAALVFRVSGSERRNPFCQQHAAAMGCAVEAMAQRGAAEAN